MPPPGSASEPPLCCGRTMADASFGIGAARHWYCRTCLNQRVRNASTYVF